MHFQQPSDTSVKGEEVIPIYSFLDCGLIKVIDSWKEKKVGSCVGRDPNTTNFCEARGAGRGKEGYLLMNSAVLKSYTLLKVELETMCHLLFRDLNAG